MGIDNMESMPSSAMAYPKPVTSMRMASRRSDRRASGRGRRAPPHSRRAQSTTRTRKTRAGISSMARPARVWAWRGTTDEPTTRATAAPHPVATARRNRGRRTRTRVGSATAIRFWGRNLTGSPLGLHAPCPRTSASTHGRHNLPWLREGAWPEHLASIPYPGGRRTCGNDGSTAGAGSRSAPSLECHRSGGSRGCGPVRPRGRDCARRSDVASALQDGRILQGGPGRCHAAPEDATSRLRWRRPVPRRFD